MKLALMTRLWLVLNRHSHAESDHYSRIRPRAEGGG